MSEAQLKRAVKRKKSKPPASLLPWPCVVLAVDTATNSGWAVYYAGELQSSGEVNVYDRTMVDLACEAAIEMSLDMVHQPPVVLVLEKPLMHHRSRSVKGALMALGAARFAWLQSWQEAGGKMSRVVRVSPQTWRARLFGTTKDTRQSERLTAQKQTDSHLLGDDECAAICIGKWASHAGEVGAVLPKRMRAEMVNAT